MTGDREWYRGRRVLVLGAAGFIGRWVTRTLQRANADAVLVTRAEADLRDPDAVRRLLLGARPEVTFNLAGYGVDTIERRSDDACRLNVGLVQALVKALAKCGSGSRLVHVGSAQEYGAAGGDLAEDTPPRPTTLYGMTKLAGTLALSAGCQATGLRGVTARLFTVYGPGEHAGRLLPALCEAARSGHTLDLTAGEQRRDFTYIGDIADGLLRLGSADLAPGEVVNLATGRLTRVRDFAEAAARQLALPAGRLRFGAVPTRGDEMNHLPVAVRRVKDILGWIPPTTVARGVRSTLRILGLAPQPVG